MGYLLHLVLAFGTLFVPELLGAPGLAEGAASPAALLLLLPLPHGMLLVLHLLQRRGRPRGALLLERLLAQVPVLGQLAAVFVCGWLPALARWLPGGVGDAGMLRFESGWPDAGLLLGILPFAVLEVLTIDARSRAFADARALARGWRGLQLRLFASSLLPFVAVALLATLVTASDPWRVRLEEVAVLGAAFALLVLALAVLGLPRLFALALDTVSLPAGALRSGLEGLAARARFRCADLALWRTGGLLANAMILGFTPRTRTVIFSDALLARMELDELQAVLGHEIGHARRHHGPLLGAFSFTVLFGGELLITRFAPEGDAWSWSLGIALLLGWSLAFGRLSRSMEHEADLESARVLGDARPLAASLFKVTDPARYGHGSWRHPSTRARVRFLMEAERDPSLARRLRRRLRASGRAALAGLVLVAGAGLHEALGTWDEDWIVADLRLGRYEAAAARVDAGVEVSERLDALVRRARSLPDAGRAPAELLRAGQQAQAAGDWARALDLVQLAVLGGARSAQELLEALDARAAGQELDAHDLERAWQRAEAPGG